MATETETTGFLRHLRHCSNATLPGDRLPFLLSGHQVGWVRRSLAGALAAFPQVTVTDAAVDLRDAAALPGIARNLATQGHFRWRNEAFDVRLAPDGPPVAQIDRGAIPSFGVLAEGVHLNGLVRRADGLHVWIARRAADKALDPGKLDNITAGGMPAGLTPEQTLVKEAAEEAAIPAALASQASRVATIGYAMQRTEGLRRDLLHCYDLVLPEDFVPNAADGEVAGFELWPIVRVLKSVRDTDDFKFNVNLVLIDLFLRQGLIPADDAAPLRAALDAMRA